MTAKLAQALRALLDRQESVVEVRVAVARGSTPREAGVRMFVASSAVFGTIGGGRLEWQAIARARQMLADNETAARVDVPLGPAVGQCCGGHVSLALQRADEHVLATIEAEERAEAATHSPVLLFGAGHVGKAMANALAPLPFRVRWIDSRPSEFPPEPPCGVEIVATERLAAEVEAAQDGAAYLVLTHSHALDFELCAAVLERGDFGYLGLIGSATKRARFERGFRELGIDRGRIARLVCPIGSRSLRDKRPAVIAALVAAELITTLATPAMAAKPTLVATG